MMVAEIAGGTFYGSLAVVTDGFHMATHALALLVAALAYTYARGWSLRELRHAWLLGGGDQHGHAHAHGPGDGAKHAAHAQDEPRRIDTGRGIFLLEVVEDGVLPRFRLRQEDHPEIASKLGDKAATIETERPGGVRQTFHFADRGAFLE